MDLRAKAEAGYDLVLSQVRALPEGPQRSEMLELLEEHRELLLPMYEDALRKAYEKRAARKAGAAENTQAEAPPSDSPPDEWTPKARTAANLQAVIVLSQAEAEQRPLTQPERQAVAKYSGWGGLSIEKIADRIPPGWRPEERGLIHEYYTPSMVARAVAEMVRPLLPDLVDAKGEVLALEPAAGIGRFVNALSGPGFDQVRWQAVEYSRVSSRLLELLRPDVKVAAGTSFERWVALNQSFVDGALQLVVSNPPYGQRGASITEDPDKDYRKAALGQKAYAYFLRRTADLLAPGGLGIYLIPYGFMTGHGAALSALRASVLRRHHISAAFRLPSGIFPGAMLVTDLVVLRARGGELSEVLPEDKFIAEGKYFESFPAHILGKEVGKAGDDDDTTAKPRWGYQVEGTFTGLPPLVEREVCRHCAAVPYRKLTHKPTQKEKAEALEMAERPPHVEAAATLGERVADFLAARAGAQAGDLDAAQRAKALYPELREALLAWAAQHGSPHADAALQPFGKLADLVSLRSAFTDKGELAEAFAQAPAYEPRYTGGPEDVNSQAEFLYRTRRAFTIEDLRVFHRAVGGGEHPDEHFLMDLQSAGWCREGDEWLPERDYYTGALWPRYDRARADAAATDDAQLAVQAQRLLDAIKPLGISDIGAEPRLPFVPLQVLRDWMNDFCGLTLSKDLERAGGLVKVAEWSYLGLLNDNNSIGRARLATVIGYLNHDFSLFRIPEETELGGEPFLVERRIKPTGERETPGEAQDRARIAYHERAVQHFRAWLDAHPAEARAVEDAYNRAFRGFVTPEYGQDDLQIARWRGTFRLRPHQRAGARRLLTNRRGLLAFDVGVGKTLTGIATIAKAREEGWARRPVVVVPNTIVWKWHKEFTRALPDYRIVVIGSNRRVMTRGARKGALTSEIDTPAQRAEKWRAFQAGLYDVALVTFSVLGRQQLRADTISGWLDESPAVLRELSLKARNLLHDAQRSKSKGTKSKRDEKQAERDAIWAKVEHIKEPTEREKAIIHEVRDRWIAERLESAQQPDPGIFWEDLGVDLICVDEAQNFKNLFSVGPREGGVPKYLGAIQEGSDRAWDLALRAGVVRRRTGGNGVVLLSATPAKNSPIEYFSLLHYVDDQAWTRLGILDAEVYVDRYLRIELKQILTNDGTWKQQSVVAGFKNLEELRDLIFRYAEFRTAEEVGLKLPPVERKEVVVEMGAEQASTYRGLVKELQEARGRAATDPAAKYKMLGLLQKMSMVSLHPELHDGPLNKDGKPEWTWGNAGDRASPHSPKLDAVAERIRQKPDCGHIIFADNVAVHAWMVEVLMEAGVARDRIAILNGDQAKSPAERQAIAEGFNGEPELDAGKIVGWVVPPKYDIVIANAVAYEGIDLQVRTCTVHHLDLPWEPATLQQRNGRAVRQGNTQAVIAIYYYLSRKSFDGNRLQMILGKLGWMKDILSTADRETSNPAAGSEMSADEMLLMVAEDPEAARRLLAEQERRRQEETRRVIRGQAWDALRSIVSKTASLAAVPDEIGMNQRHKQIGELAKYLASVDPDVWPYLFLVEKARAGVPFVFREYPEGEGQTALFGLWDGLRYSGGEGAPIASSFELAILEGGRVTRRDRDAVTWQELARGDQVQLAFQLAMMPAERLTAAWTEEDTRAWEPKANEWIAVYRAGRWTNFADTFSLHRAPSRWRQIVWERVGPGIVDAIAHRAGGYGYNHVAVPVREPGGRLALVDGAALQGRDADVLPFTQAGYDEFLARAPQTRLKWAELNEASQVWFGEKIPQNLLAARERAADQAA